MTDPRITNLLAGMDKAVAEQGADPRDCVRWEIQFNQQTGAPMVVMLAPITATGSNIVNIEGRPYVTSFFTLVQFDNLVESLRVAQSDLRRKYPKPLDPKEPGYDT